MQSVCLESTQSGFDPRNPKKLGRVVHTCDPSMGGRKIRCSKSFSIYQYRDQSGLIYTYICKLYEFTVFNAKFEKLDYSFGNGACQEVNFFPAVSSDFRTEVCIVLFAFSLATICFKFMVFKIVFKADFKIWKFLLNRHCSVHTCACFFCGQLPELLFSAVFIKARASQVVFVDSRLNVITRYRFSSLFFMLSGSILLFT